MKEVIFHIGNYLERIKNFVPRRYSIVLSIVFFIVGINILYKNVGLYKHIQDRPTSVHVWAQCARASIALNYYKGDMNFFKPKIHKFLDGDGITGLEFPFTNYIPAVCYKLFGFDEGYYRGFVLFSITLGLLCFYLLLSKIIRNWLLSFGLIISAFSSPVFYYYSINFMPDMSSLGYALVALFFLFRIIEFKGKENINLFFFWLFASLAALVKITSLVIVITVFVLLVLDYYKFFKKRSNENVFKNKLKLTLVLLASVITVVSWYVYSHYIESVAGTASFAMAPVRVTDWATANEVWQRIKSDHKFEYYPYETYMLILSIIGLMILGFKYVNRLYATIVIVVTLGNLCVIYFFFYQFKDHDYYIITLTSSVFLLFLTFADFLKRLSSQYALLLSYVFIVVLFFNLKESVIYSKKIFTMRFSREYIPYFDKSASFNDLEPKLRKFGIKRTDRTICGFDNDWCASLYKMDQLGYTFDEGVSKDQLKTLLESGSFKYLVLTDSTKFNKLYLNNFEKNLVATHRGLLIYKLKRN